MVKVDFTSGNIYNGNDKVGNMFLTHRRNNYVVLSSIVIIPEHRGFGFAQQAMEQLIDYANKNNYILALTPSNDFGANKNKLINWYKSLGFVMNKGRNKDFQTMELMYKNPENMDESVEHNIIDRDIWNMNENTTQFDVNQLKNMRSFAQRIKYLDSTLRKLGAGTARIVYEVDPTKVLKLAKNTKGLAQNEVEISMGMHDYYAKNIVSEVSEADEENSTWLIAEMGRKLTPKRFKELTDVDIKELGQWLRHDYFANQPKSRFSPSYENVSPERSSELWDNEFSSAVMDLMKNYDLPSGDLGKISSYGEVIRNGQPEVVLIDYGLTEDVYKKNYMREEHEEIDTQRELFDGGYGGYALLPARVGEEFIQEAKIESEVGWFEYDERLSPDQNDLFLSHLEVFNKGQGHFKQLMADIEEFAKTHGKKAIVLEPDITMGKEYTQFLTNLYKKYGFIPYESDPSLLIKTLDENINLPIGNLYTFGGIKEDFEDYTKIPENILSKAVRYIEEFDKLRGGLNSHISDLYRNYMINVQNYDKGLKIAKDDIKYFNNLLKLQEFLKRFGLVKEDLKYNSVSDASPESDQYVMEDTNSKLTLFGVIITDNNEIEKLLKKLNFDYFVGIGEWDNDVNTQNNSYVLKKPESLTKGEFIKTLKMFSDKFNVSEFIVGDKNKTFLINNDGKIEELTDFDLVSANVNEERVKSWMPKMSTPIIKKSCLLGGNKDGTSDDCSQGDTGAVSYKQNVEESSIQEPINEIGEANIQPYQLNPDNVTKEGIDFSFTTESGMEYVIQTAFEITYKDYYLEDERIPNTDRRYILSNLPDKIVKLSVSYTTREAHDKIMANMGKVFRDKKDQSDYYPTVNTGEPLKILSTIAFATKAGYKKAVEMFGTVNIISYVPKKDNEEDSRRANINRMFIEKGLQKHGIHILRVILVGQGVNYVISTDEMKGSVNAYEGTSPKDIIRDSIKGILKEEKVNYGCLMAYFDIPNWNKIINKIKEEDVYDDGSGTFGREEEPHITILYGFHREITADNFKEIVENIKEPIEAELVGISVFDNPNFDVVKMDVKPTAELLKLRKAVETFPATLTYKDYHPHMTIAYVKKGEGKKYIHTFKKPIVVKSDILTFSDKDKNKTQFPLKEKLLDEGNMNISENPKMTQFVEQMRSKPFIKTIIGQGGEVYAVGGVVRDLLLNKPNKDIDLVVRLIPFEKLLEILRRFGTANLEGESFSAIKFVDKQDGLDYDVVLPRTEKATGGGGHKDFEITGDERLPIEHDLTRRDAKINSMAININSGAFIDPLDGLKDIKNKVMSMTNSQAFIDDPLRMMRMIQFAARFGYDIEPETMKLIQANASNINKMAKERSLGEIIKIIDKKGDKRKGAQLLKDSKIFKELFGFEPKQSSFDRSPFEEVKTLGEYIFLLTNASPSPSKLFINTFMTDNATGSPTYREIFAFETAFKNVSADIHRNRLVINMMAKTAPQTIDSDILPQELIVAAKELKSGKYPISLKQLAINGNDLMQLGYQGKSIGDMLDKLLSMVYYDKIRNDKEELLNFAKQKQGSPITESIDKNEMKKENNVRYSAIVLDDKSRSKLLDMIGSYIPKGWDIIAHHATINLGKLDPQFGYKVGDVVQMRTIKMGLSNMAMAVMVDGVKTKNSIPHITIAINKAEGGKPVMSNEIKNWRPMQFGVEMTGKVEEV